MLASEPTRDLGLDCRESRDGSHAEGSELLELAYGECQRDWWASGDIS